MIELAPFESLGAISVLSRLDPNDLIEAHLVRGAQANHLDIFADWRAMQSHAVLSLVLKDRKTGGKPFAVLALGHTGQAGVGQAALLACDHARYRRQLVNASRQIRDRMPEFCSEWGIHRIEARCWSKHPTAGGFLTACGFKYEADLPGFGADGLETFQQFAWIFEQPEGS